MEGIFFAAQRENEERKLPYLANLYANICFDDAISRPMANQLIKIAASISFRQLAIAKVVKGNRTKSITKSADEIGMGKSMWADLENGIKDPQISTLWRFAEGLDIKLSILVKMIEEDLGEEFSFLEDKTGKARG